MAATTVGVKPPLDKTVYGLIDGEANLKKLENLLSKAHGNISWNGRGVFEHPDYSGEVSISQLIDRLHLHYTSKLVKNKKLDRSARVLLKLNDLALSKLELESKNVYASSGSIFKFLNGGQKRDFHLNTIYEVFYKQEYFEVFGVDHPVPQRNGIRETIHATQQDMWDLEDDYRHVHGLPLTIRAVFSRTDEQTPSRL